MPSLQALQEAAALYNRQFQELAARIYDDGFVSCQEASEGTRYHRSARPRLRRLDRVARQCVLALYLRHKKVLDRTDRRAANDALRAHYGVLEDLDKLVNDSNVILKIFADVLRDCPDVPVTTPNEV